MHVKQMNYFNDYYFACTRHILTFKITKIKPLAILRFAYKNLRNTFKYIF